MAQTNFNVGAIANDGTGDALRDAFIAQQAMNTDLYTNKVDKVAGKDLSENDFTDADKTKLYGIEEGAQVNLPIEWTDILNAPDQLFASVGHFHYNDSATHTTPLVVLPSVPKKLTNDTLGVGTEKDFAPYGVADVWETTDNAFTFSPLDLGDQAQVRFDFLLSSTSPLQKFTLYVKFGVGSPSEYDMLVSSWVEKDVITYGQIIREISFSIDNEDWLYNQAEIYILSDDDASVKVNGWYTPIIRKSVNVINIEGDFLSSIISSYSPATTPLAGTELALIEQGGTFKKVAVSEFGGGGSSVDLYPIKYLYQATGVGMGTYGTNVMVFQGTQSDVYVSGNGNSYRKIVSATTAGTSIYAREASFTRVAPNKGFQFLLRFRIADAATISDVRGFHGLQMTSGFSNTEISANVQQMCGIGCDGTDTNIHIFSRQSVLGTLVKIDTGFSKTLNHEYLLTQERLPNSNYVVITLKNLTSSTEFTSTVVNNSSYLTIVNHRNNNASTLSCGFEIQRQELNLSE